MAEGKERGKETEEGHLRQQEVYKPGTKAGNSKAWGA